MAITTLNLRGINRSDTATSGQVITATSAVAADFQDAGGGAWNLIKTLTSDGSDASFTFVNGTSSVVLDATYNAYAFIYTSIHGETGGANFMVNFSTDTGSNYNVTKTTTCFDTYHLESTASGNWSYNATADVAQDTGDQPLTWEVNMGADADQSTSGTLYLYDPASTVFIKHFTCKGIFSATADYMIETNLSGYCNTTSAVDGVIFKFSSGEIQGGSISLYGLSK